MSIFHFMGPVTSTEPGGKPVSCCVNDANAIAFSGGHYHVFTQDKFQFAHYRSKDLVRWERRPIALPRPAWDGALSLLPPDDGGAVILYDLPPEPSNLAMARIAANATHPADLEAWDTYVGGAPLTIDWSAVEPSIQKPDSPTCCSPSGGSIPPCTTPVKPPHCKGLFFPGPIWKDLNGQLNFLATIFLNNASWRQRIGRFVATNHTLHHWKLADPYFAGGRFSEHDGAWLLPVPGSGVEPGDSGRYLLNAGGGDEFVLGDYDGRSNTFTNTSAVQRMDFGLYSADWTAVGRANGRVLTVGWLSNYRTGVPVPQNNMSRLSLLRELHYDRDTDSLRVLPVAELEGLRNGSLTPPGGVHAMLRGNDTLVLVHPEGDGAVTADLEVSFSLGDDLSVGASFGAAAFCPSGAGVDLCTRVTLDVSPGGLTSTMSISTPTTMYATAHNFTSAPFPLHGRRLNLRLITDRAVVEAYSGSPVTTLSTRSTRSTRNTRSANVSGFDAVGQAAVVALSFPPFGATGMKVFAVSGEVEVEAKVWTMGCGWVDGS